MPKGMKFEDWAALKLKDRMIPNLRWQVVAPKGKIFVGGDKKQLEARIIALRSGDPYLCSAFNTEADIHTEFAKVIFPQFLSLPDSERKYLRDLVKRAEYGYFYGALIVTVWQALVKEGLNISIRQIQEMFSVFRKRMPYVERWHSTLISECGRTGRIADFLDGRHRDFPLGQADRNVVLNFGVQSSAASIMNRNMDRLDQEISPTWQILMQCHDAAVLEVPEEDADLAVRVMDDCLTDEYTLNGVTMKFPADVHKGYSWGEV
jgi:DNA polymerase-1